MSEGGSDVGSERKNGPTDGDPHRDDGPIDESTIFETPLFELDMAVPATVYGKAEWYNLYEAPYGGGSVKSRIAKGMLDAAEESGDLTDGMTVIEPTSGNTGSEIARLATSRGYDVEIVMPDNASGGKVGAIRETGAEIHFVDADRGYDAVIETCEEIVMSDPTGYYRPNQYENAENPGTHERTTAAEIAAQTDGDVTHFVAGVGTGGTITGTGRGLVDRIAGPIEIVGFEPAEPLHAIDGLKYLRTGDHYHPETYDESVLDGKVYVETGDAYERARDLRERYLDREVSIVDRGQHSREVVREHAKVDGQFVVGTSSGAAIQAVYQLDKQGNLQRDDTVVLMLCDRGDKYADIPLWEDYLSGAGEI
ncbi:MAG: PLP-dependent cysteine synthase family protein [Halodesulfurarchaeum sp.]